MYVQVRHRNTLLPTPEPYSPLRAQLPKKEKSVKLLKTPFQHILPYMEATQAPETPFEPWQTAAVGVTEAPDQVCWQGGRQRAGCNLSSSIPECWGQLWRRLCTAQPPGQPPPLPFHIQVQLRRFQGSKTFKSCPQLCQISHLSSSSVHSETPLRSLASPRNLGGDDLAGLFPPK